MALARVVEGLFVRAGRESDGERRDGDPPAVEHAEELVEPLASLAEQVLFGDLRIDERELPRIRRAPAHFSIFLRTREPRRILRHDDVADLGAPAGLTGHG